MAQQVSREEFADAVLRLRKLVDRLDDQLAAHEQWHRDTLVQTAATREARRLAVWSLAVSALSAVAAMIATIIITVR